MNEGQARSLMDRPPFCPFCRSLGIYLQITLLRHRKLLSAANFSNRYHD